MPRQYESDVYEQWIKSKTTRFNGLSLMEPRVGACSIRRLAVARRGAVKERVEGAAGLEPRHPSAVDGVAGIAVGKAVGLATGATTPLAEDRDLGTGDTLLRPCLRERTLGEGGQGHPDHQQELFSIRRHDLPDRGGAESSLAASCAKRGQLLEFCLHDPLRLAHGLVTPRARATMILLTVLPVRGRGGLPLIGGGVTPPTGADRFEGRVPSTTSRPHSFC